MPHPAAATDSSECHGQRRHGSGFHPIPHPTVESLSWDARSLLQHLLVGRPLEHALLIAGEIGRLELGELAEDVRFKPKHDSIEASAVAELPP